MVFIKKSWWSKYIITPHHRHVDILVRVAALLVVIGAVLAIFVRSIATSPISISEQPHEPLHVSQAASLTFHLINNGGAIRDGVSVEFLVSPETIAISSGDPLFDPYTRRFDISFLQKNSEVTIPIIVVPSQIGEHPFHMIVRKIDDPSVILTELTTILSVPKPILHPSVRAQYFSAEGEQLGRGPLPPMPGETTRYLVSLHIPYEGDGWRDIEISAPLGEHASWTGFIPDEGKNIRYDAQARTMTWSVDEWPEGMTSEEQLDLGAAFEVAITPTESDRGGTLALLGPISISAVHKASGETYKAILDPVLTDQVLP